MKKLSVLLLSVCMFILVLSGCTNSNKPSPSNPVTLTMWHNYGGDMQKSMDTLIDKFNSTAGKEQGIIINVTAISSSSELNETLEMIANGDPGAPQIPNIFTGYPKIAIQLQEKGMLTNLDNYFSKKELDSYVAEFVKEGRLSDGGLYVFPLAKSTEILYVNKTLFDRFAEATGASQDDLLTFEGISKLSKMYYDWTDSKTPDILNDGKQFFTADSWFNIAEVGMEQLGTSLFDKNNNLALNDKNYEYIFNNFYLPASTGGVAIYNGYSSDLSKTGDLVCSTGSSAGILFYGDTVTYPNNITEKVEYSILPYPTFNEGKKVALQRGGGLMVAKADAKKEYAASVFIKWLTASEQNMEFISSTGYLPVTKKSFEQDMTSHLESLKDLRIKKMLSAVLDMYKNYSFFTAPAFSQFDEISKNYDKNFKSIINEQRKLYLEGNGNSVDIALNILKNK